MDENGNVATEGRVEYCVGGRWGTVCNTAWSDTSVEVLCSQLMLNAESEG